MPEAILKFKLPEEKAEYDMCNHAGKFLSVLHEMYQFLRDESKHGEGKYAKVYDQLIDLLNEEGIDLFA